MTEFNLDGFSFTPDTTARDAEAYPRIWWYNGSKQAGTNGHFYTTEREFAECPKGWTQVERYGDEVGYTADALRFAVIRKRVQAYSEDRSSGMAMKTWHPHYKPGMKLYTELLCIVDGIDEPVVWIVKGMLGKAVTSKFGLLAAHHDMTIKQAMNTWKGEGVVPTWAFWCPIKADTTDKGKPVYTDTGYGSTVTLPKLDIPIHVPREVLVSLYVGRTVLDYGLEVYKASAEWQKTMRTNDESQSPPAPTQTTEDSVEPF